MERSPSEPTVNYSVFEGLFVRVLKPEGAFAEQLKAVGFDLKRPVGIYTKRVWHDAVMVACRHTYPMLAIEDAQREIGKRFVEGFFDTITGKVMSVALGFLSVESLIQRLPKYVAMTATGMELRVTEEPDKTWRVSFRDVYSLPDFVAGLMEASFLRGGHRISAKVRSRNELGFELTMQELPRTKAKNGKR
jgi:uncharacterized protein (TIGR02265 family)